MTIWGMLQEDRSLVQGLVACYDENIGSVNVKEAADRIAARWVYFLKQKLFLR
jgi:hypothetical protein